MKNIDKSVVLDLANEIQLAPGQVISKTLAQNDAMSITLFALAKDEEIAAHVSKGDALVVVLEGKGKITIDGKAHEISAGQSMVMPASLPHALLALDDFKFLLVISY